jgi:flagellar export protein FliJ
MKRFTFRLDSILKIRAREEDSAREILERCLSAQRSAERELDDANLRLDQSEDAMTGKRSGKTSIHDHLILLNAVRLDRDRCVNLTTRLAAATRETEAQRQLFQTARRRHQAILRLRERHSRAHAAAEQRREDNEISDFIISRHRPPEQRACA